MVVRCSANVPEGYCVDWESIDEAIDWDMKLERESMLFGDDDSDHPCNDPDDVHFEYQPTLAEIGGLK